jgi:hypothetical protein
MMATGSLNLGGDTKVYPFMLAPGIAHARQSMFQRTSLLMGATPLYTPDSSDAISILPPNALNGYAVRLLQDLNDDPGFRVEFLGDLIADCGHEPIHLEIHPATNIVLHASTPDMISSKGYSVFANKRAGLEDTTAEFDLWPGVRPKGKKRPNLFIDSPTAATGVPSNLDFAPFPPQSPNRIRCRLTPGAFDVGDGFLCANSPRMLPSCTTIAGGGLLHVGWE